MQQTRQPPPPTPLVITPGFALYNTPPKQVPWLIDGLVPAESLFCLNGRGGTYKSWSLKAMGIAVASAHLGHRFMDFFDCEVRGPRNSVLFVELEETRNQAAKKYQWLLKGSGHTPQEIQDLLMAFVVSQPVRMDKTEDLDGLRRVISATKPDLVIWDNARRLMRGDMNSSEWAGILAETVKTFQTIWPSSHGIIHHWRKRSSEKDLNDPDQMGSGNAALRDACDVWLPVEMDDFGVLTLRQTKNRDGELLRPFNYTVRISDANQLAKLEYSGVASAANAQGPTGQPNCADAILGLLNTTPDQPRTKGSIIRDLAGTWSEMQVRRGLAALQHSQDIFIRKGGGRVPTQIILIRYANLLVDSQTPAPGPIPGVPYNPD